MSDLTIPAAHAQRLRPLVLPAVDFADKTAAGDHRRQVAAFTLAGQLAGLIAMEDERKGSASIVDRHSIRWWPETITQAFTGERTAGSPESGSTPVNPDPVTNGGETPMT